MANYRLITGSSDVLYLNKTRIPADAGNADWQTYQVWLAVPNTPDAALSGSAGADPAGTASTACNAAADLTALKAALVTYFNAIKLT